METETIQTTGNKSKKSDRDGVVGKALSRSLGNSGQVGPCPTAAEMADFLDGAATEEKRQRLLAHLAVCDRCREIHLLAAELGGAAAVQPKRTGWRMAGGALATAALALLAIKLTVQQPAPTGQDPGRIQPPRQEIARAAPATREPPTAPVHGRRKQPPPFSTILAASQLARAESTDSLVTIIGAPGSRSYGFAGNGSRRATAFATGRELFELELWLAAGDRERAGLAGAKLAPLLRSVGGKKVEAPVENLLRQLEREEGSAKIEESISRLEGMLSADDRETVRLGGWAAAARVATAVGRDPYFAGNPPQRFRRSLGANLTPGARDLLRQLSVRSTAADQERMKRLLDELADAM